MLCRSSFPEGGSELIEIATTNPFGSGFRPGGSVEEKEGHVGGIIAREGG